MIYAWSGSETISACQKNHCQSWLKFCTGKMPATIQPGSSIDALLAATEAISHSRLRIRTDHLEAIVGLLFLLMQL